MISPHRFLSLPSMKSDSDRPELSLAGDDRPPISVPTFPCIVYVAERAGGGVHARVANLAGIEVDAENERAALSQIVPEFKRQVSEMVAVGNTVPWVDPPTEPEPNEQKRFIPVHL